MLSFLIKNMGTVAVGLALAGAAAAIVAKLIRDKGKGACGGCGGSCGGCVKSIGGTKKRTGSP